MEIKKSTLYVIGIILLIVIGGNFLLKSTSSSIQTKDVIKEQAGNSEVQEIVIGMKDYNYYPNTITVQSGSTVRIKLDKTVGGCFRDFTIRELGIHKYLESDTEYIEFTPTTPGMYRFACSMGMGTGTLIVK